MPDPIAIDNRGKVMSTVQKVPVGRERRRTDLYGRARRLLYGLLLLAASPGALAADELASVGRFKASPVAVVSQQFMVATLQGLVLLNADDSAENSATRLGNTYPRVGLDTVTARVSGVENGDAPLFRVAVAEDGSIRDGVGFDLALPDIGNFHLNLYARHNARTSGKRWSMSGEGSAPRTWSIGGTLELVRTVDGDKQLAFVPELLVDLDNSRTRYLPFQASLKFANWRSLQDRASLDEQVPQLMFKWRL